MIKRFIIEWIEDSFKRMDVEMPHTSVELVEALMELECFNEEDFERLRDNHVSWRAMSLRGESTYGRIHEVWRHLMLRECPFCGSIPNYAGSYWYEGERVREQVSCQCGATLKRFDGVINKWNERC